MIRFRIIIALAIIWFATWTAMPLVAAASDENAAGDKESFLSKLPIETHGFYEVRGG